MEKKSNFTSFIYYFKVFLRLAKGKFLILPFLMLLVGIFDSIGIVLFFPLLETLNFSEEAVNNRLISFLQYILNYLNIYTFQGVLLFICTVFLIKFIINFFQEFAVQRMMRDLYRQLSYKILKGWGDSDYKRLYLNINTGYFTNILIKALGAFLGACKYYCMTLINILYIVVYLVISLLLDVKITLIASFFGIFILNFLFKLLKDFF